MTNMSAVEFTKRAYGYLKRRAERASCAGRNYAHKNIYPKIPKGLREKIEYITFKREVKKGVRLIDTEEFKGQLKNGIRYLREERGVQEIGSYLEFGVFYGTSIVCAYEVMKEFGMESPKIVGFDSFEGLPEEASREEEGPWKEGDFRSNYRFTKEYVSENTNNCESISIVKGWLSDTLNRDNIEKYGIGNASIIMMDCDIYASAEEALRFCEGLIGDETIIIFDDWHSGGLAEKGLGEKKAFEEFLERNEHVRAKEIGEYAYRGSTNGKVFCISAKGVEHEV